MVVARNQRLTERFRILRSHGITSSTYQRFKGHVYGYDVAELGYNYRLDEIRAAIGIEQLRKLPVFNVQRKERVERYRRMILEKLPQVRVPFAERNTDSAYHIFPVLLPGDDEMRDKVLRGMAEFGVQCSMHYKPIHLFSAYKSFVAKVPFTEYIATSMITLPLFPTLSDEQMDIVIDGLQTCLVGEAQN